MQKHDRLSRAASARGVVVESRDTQIDELAAHRGKMDAGRGRDKRADSWLCTQKTNKPAPENRSIALAFRDENGILMICALARAREHQIVVFDNDLATGVSI